MADNGEVSYGDWVKVTEHMRFNRGWVHPQTGVQRPEVWEGRVEEIKMDGTVGPDEFERLVCFTDEHTGEVMEWYEWQVEIIRPTQPAPKGFFPHIDELIESLKHSS